MFELIYNLTYEQNSTEIIYQKNFWVLRIYCILITSSIIFLLHNTSYIIIGYDNNLKMTNN